MLFPGSASMGNHPVGEGLTGGGWNIPHHPAASILMGEAVCDDADIRPYFRPRRRFIRPGHSHEEDWLHALPGSRRPAVQKTYTRMTPR